MGAAQVAGAVRGRALVRRRLGRATARRLAGLDFVAAIDELAESPYGRYVRRGHSLEQAQAATLATLLWHLRVLAGWQSRAAAAPLRLLGAGFELANIDDLLFRLDGGASAGEPYELGALALAWSRLAPTTNRAQLRTALARSAWGDPGADDAWSLSVLPCLRWLHRVSVRVPAADHWACGAALLLLAREQLVRGRQVSDTAAQALRPLVGPDCLAATSLPALTRCADRRGRWVLDGLTGADELWRAEIRWWDRLDRDGTTLAHGTGFTAEVAIGCAAALAADAWRVRAALAAAARGGGTPEVFDAPT